MEITQTKTISNTYKLSLRQKIRVKDYEEGKWINAKITGIMEGQKVKIKCEDGIEYWETLQELSDPYSYKF